MHRTKIKNIGNTIKSATLNDLSRGLVADEFAVTNVSSYGISGKILSMAFDPVQSLLALGNDDGQIYVFGTKNVEVVFKVSKASAICHLRFVKNLFLVAVTDTSQLYVFSLNSKQILADYNIPGEVTILESDPTLDFVYLGLHNGTILIFDVANGHLAPEKIMNLQTNVRRMEDRGSNKVLDLAIRSLQIHPRDIGSLLIAYTKSVVLYSVIERKVKRSFEYEVPPGAPGGDLLGVERARRPDVMKASFHPNGLNILTCHEDGSLVFWDANTGTLIQARTLFDTDVDKPQSSLFNSPGQVQPMQYNPFIQVEWVCEANPENTSLLIAGGDSVKSDGNVPKNLNLTRIEFGTTPKYTITSYEKMSAFYSNSRNLNIFPISQSSSIRSFLPLPISSPFFAGNHDPNVILVLLENGTLEVLRYPLGKLINSSSILPPSLAWIHPKMTFLSASIAPRTQWIGLLEGINDDRKKRIAARPQGFYEDTILKGGAASLLGARVFAEGRSVFISGHFDGSVKLWDASRAELDESSVIEIDTCFGFGRTNNPSPISKVSFSGYTTDLMASNFDGETIMYKYGSNRLFDPSVTQDDYDHDSSLTQGLMKNNPLNTHGLIVNVENNIPVYIHKGFLPVIMVKPPVSKNSKRLSVTAIKNSHIEFSVIAYNDGQFIVIDRRVSDILFLENVNKISQKRSKSGSLSYISSIEFGIMKGTEDAKYSSILLFLGTSVGNLITFQILPGSASSSSKSRFQVKFLSCVDADHSKIRNIIPINIADGSSAVAKAREFAQLASGVLIKGLIFTVSSYGIRLFKSPIHKSASVNFQNHGEQNGEIIAADVTRVRPVMTPGEKSELSCLTVLFENSTVKTLTIPSLTEITTMSLSFPINRSFATQSTILLNGDIMVRKSDTEGCLVHVTRFGANFGKVRREDEGDLLYNKEMKIPPRPVFNSLQWARGSKLLTLEDLQFAFLGERRLRSRYPAETELASDVVSPSSYQNFSNTISSNMNNSSPNPSTGLFSSNSRASTSNSGSPSVKKGGGWGFDMTSISKSLNNTISGLEDRFSEVGQNVSEQMNGSMESGKNTVMKSLVKSKFGF